MEIALCWGDTSTDTPVGLGLAELGGDFARAIANSYTAEGARTFVNQERLRGLIITAAR